MDSRNWAILALVVLAALVGCSTISQVDIPCVDLDARDYRCEVSFTVDF